MMVYKEKRTDDITLIIIVLIITDIDIHKATFKSMKQYTNIHRNP